MRSASPADQIAELKRSGFPTAIADLNAFYPPVPAESNSVLGVAKAAESFVSASPDLRSFRFPPPGDNLPNELLNLISVHLAQNGESLVILDKALRLPSSRYPFVFIDQNNFLLPHLADAKHLTQLLNYHSLFHAATGDPAMAFHSLTNAFKLAATLRNAPPLITELVHIACVAIALNCLEHFLVHQSLSDAQLSQISSLILAAETDAISSANRAIVGERALGIESFRDVASAPAPASATTADKLKLSFFRLLGFHDRDLRLYLELMDRLIDATRQPFPIAYKKTMELDQEMQQRFSRGLGRFALLTRSGASALWTLVRKEAALVTRLRCAQTAVAIERYRLANAKSLPSTLDALIPMYLPVLPVDPVVGEPLSLEFIPGGFQVFSAIAAEKLKNKQSSQFSVIREE